LLPQSTIHRIPHSELRTAYSVFGTGREFLSLEAHSQSAELVRFSPDGNVLASSGVAPGTIDQHEILIWNAESK
jgi:WD40 repeat protein